MRRRFPFLAMFLVFAWQNVSANQEQLSFRVNNLHQIEAVISGITGCGLPSVSGPVNAIEIGSSAISINSLQGGGGDGCPANSPTFPYELVAVLGDLPRQTYTVNWTISYSQTGPRFPLMSAILAVDALFPSGIPTISGAGVAVLALLLLVAGRFILRRRSL